MKDILSKLFIFAAGAGIGSAVTWKLVKSKYEQIAQEEIDSVKEYYHDKYDDKDDSEPVEEWPNILHIEEVNEGFKTEKPDLKDYANMIKEAAYATEVATERPYVIQPLEYGEMDDYETRSLVHYNDGVLVDENGEVVEDVDHVVGGGYDAHIGDYEEDAVHIRNDVTKTDYEVLADPRNYADIEYDDSHPEG